MAFPQRKPKAGGSKAAAAPRPARKPLPTWQVPTDFKPHFLLVSFVTEADGLIGTRFKATRYVGRYAEDVDDKKKFDLGAYDPKTAAALHGRLSSVLFKPSNDKKYGATAKERATQKGGMRLPPKAMFSVLIRVGKKSADSTLTARVASVFQHVKSEKTGRVRQTQLEKTDPAYRMIRRASRILPGAFAEVLMPPKRTRTRSNDADE